LPVCLFVAVHDTNSRYCQDGAGGSTAGYRRYNHRDGSPAGPCQYRRDVAKRWRASFWVRHEFEAEDGVAATYWDDEPSRRLRSDITAKRPWSGLRRLRELKAMNGGDDDNAASSHPAEFRAGRMFKRPQLTATTYVPSSPPTQKAIVASSSHQGSKADRRPASF
jgi:hypothetical protein